LLFVPSTIDGHCSIGARLLVVPSTIDGDWYSFGARLLADPSKSDGWKSFVPSRFDDFD